MRTLRLKLLLGVAAALTFSGAAAHAAITLSVGPGPDPGLPAGYALTLDYDGFDSGFFTQSGDLNTPTVEVFNQAAVPLGHPAGNTFAYITDGQEYVLTTATPILTGFSFYVGSIDFKNKIAFYNGPTLLDSFGGIGIGFAGLGALDGDRISVLNNRRLTFDFNGAVADRVVLSTPGKNSFEWDDVGVTSASVPEPATWALMITGFSLLGAALRRRRHAKAVAA